MGLWLCLAHSDPTLRISTCIFVSQGFSRTEEIIHVLYMCVFEQRQRDGIIKADLENYFWLKVGCFAFVLFLLSRWLLPCFISGPSFDNIYLLITFKNFIHVYCSYSLFPDSLPFPPPPIPSQIYDLFSIMVTHTHVCTHTYIYTHHLVLLICTCV